MRISLNWLKELVPLDVDAQELAERLTMLGLEIEAIHERGKDISDVYVGHILEIRPHPDADKLVVCRTDIGKGEPLQIVCGATNMKVGDKVPTAIDGATLPGGFTIGSRKMRGVQSCGMMCSAREMGLGEEHSGLMILDPNAPIGQDIRQFLGLEDTVFEIEVTPNRGDWASMIGVARELSAYYGLPLSLPTIHLRESGDPAEKLSSVTILDDDLCPRYAGRVLRNVTIKPSPPWLVTRLTAAGQRPINNVVDITNYILLETGHPLHAFDYDKLAENRIIVRRAKPGESIQTLDGEQRPLQQDMLVIADAFSPQAVAGVMGGANSEVDTTTRHVFLESAYFNPRSIRSTAKRLNLLTEAAQRFQRGADPEMVLYAMNRAAMLMQELAEAEIVPGILDEYPGKQPKRQVTFRFSRTRELLGVDIETQKQLAILNGLGFEILDSTKTTCSCRVPTWRHDVSHESDLIEEIARHFGYDQIPSTVPPIRQSEKIFAPYAKIVQELRRFLAAKGLTEVLNWSFSSPESTKQAGLALEDGNMVMLQNPLSEKYAGLRTSLLPSLYSTAAYNHKRGARSIALFELGPVYHQVPHQLLPNEPLSLAIVLSVNAPLHWSVPERPWDFFDLKGYSESVSRFLRYEFTYLGSDLPAFQKGQAAEIKHRKTRLGMAGKVAFEIAAAFDLHPNTYAVEIVLEPLLKHAAQPTQFEEIPQFPPSLRDLALVVSDDISAEQVLRAVKDAGGALLQRVDIFDVYKGKPLPPDKKNLALSLVFQSPERTLTDKDTEKAIDRIITNVRKTCGAELR